MDELKFEKYLPKKDSINYNSKFWTCNHYTYLSKVDAGETNPQKQDFVILNACKIGDEFHCMFNCCMETMFITKTSTF